MINPILARILELHRWILELHRWPKVNCQNVFKPVGNQYFFLPFFNLWESLGIVTLGLWQIDYISCQNSMF